MMGRVGMLEVTASRGWWKPGTEGILKRTPELRAKRLCSVGHAGRCPLKLTVCNARRKWVVL